MPLYLGDAQSTPEPGTATAFASNLLHARKPCGHRRSRVGPLRPGTPAGEAHGLGEVPHAPPASTPEPTGVPCVS